MNRCYGGEENDELCARADGGRELRTVSNPAARRAGPATLHSKPGRLAGGHVHAIVEESGLSRVCSLAYPVTSCRYVPARTAFSRVARVAPCDRARRSQAGFAGFGVTRMPVEHHRHDRPCGGHRERFGGERGRHRATRWPSSFYPRRVLREPRPSRRTAISLRNDAPTTVTSFLKPAPSKVAVLGGTVREGAFERVGCPQALLSRNSTASDTKARPFGQPTGPADRPPPRSCPAARGSPTPCRER